MLIVVTVSTPIMCCMAVEGATMRVGWVMFTRTGLTVMFLATIWIRPQVTPVVLTPG